MREPAASALPSYDALRRDLVDAERGEGWLARCAEADAYVALSAELVGALAAMLRARTPILGPVLEVCAGDGALADALRRAGVAIVATDAAPPVHACGVEALDAETALARYRPALVLGAFVPFDAGIDAAVLRDARVREYVVLGARLGGALGSAALWADRTWHATPLPDVAQWMVTRHDAWTRDDAPLRHRGEAWWFRRASDARADSR